MVGKARGKPTPRRAQPWYLLIHQVPPNPLYLRAKVRQRLVKVGAVPLKKSVYVLPRREDCLEDFEWIAEEAKAGGGEAYVCEAEFVEKATNEALVERFRKERNIEYDAFAKEIREWGRQAARRSGANPPEEDLPSRLARARKRLEEIARNDFFQAKGKREAERLLERLGKRYERRTDSMATKGNLRKDLVGRTWVTRRGVKVDRISSAWFVRRFLDPNARFQFVDPDSGVRSGEVRFDMVGGEFTHEGDRCTLETLIVRSGVEDPALQAVAEIVHDIDLKDAKFERPETPGIQRVLNGLFLEHEDDDSRLDRGFALFDELYGSFRGPRPATRKA